MTESTYQAPAALIESLRTLLGADNVLTDDANRTLYSQDVFTKSTLAALVIQPQSSEQLASAVAEITKAGLAVVPRGGGMSYTSGFVPATEQSVLLDSSRMNRVLNINAEDMYVTVEAGCTWATLHQALQGTGLRTPYWGTLSGKYATVGGGISQNSIFWGSGQYGFAVDSVVSMDIVTADGSLVSTGSAAQTQASPFLRHYGPDLTGVFCCDNGALGVKASVTLRLIPEMKGRRFLSVEFQSFQQQSQFMSEISRRGLAMECFGFDPFLQAQRMQRDSLSNDVKALAGVMKSAGGIGKALKDATKIAMAGRRFMKDVLWSLHLMIEDRSEAGAEERLQEARSLITQFGGKELENSIPKILRANPFGPVNNMIGPAGERWVPVHALVPHSRAQAVYDLTEAVFARHSETIEKFNIGVGYLVATVSSNCFVLEPVFFWPDALQELHREAVDADHLAKIKGFEESLEGRAAVTAIRKELVAAYREFGAVHLQVGKAYQYQQGLSEPALDLVRSLKAALDPQGLMNPGALGLS
jgi:FAD/FMN-containing dehydrogenase